VTVFIIEEIIYDKLQMKDIQESLLEVQSLVDFIDDQREEHIDEGLKDILNTLKRKFKQVVSFLTGIVAKLTGSYWCPVDDNGNVQNAISPLTAGQAYKDGAINKASTLVVMSGAGRRIVGLSTKPAEAKKLYGSGNSLQYWQKINETAESQAANVNEVKMHTEDPEAKYNVVDTDELKEEIALCFKHKDLARLMIWGAPGIGKTAILMSVLNSLPNGNEYNLIVKTLSNETPDNFTLPKYVEVDGQEKATDVPKTWLPVYKPTGDRNQDQILDDACGKGLLFIDELSRATPQVLNVMLPLINEGIFNGYHLGSGWVIICASNRAEDEMAGQSDIGNALSNRFSQLYYEPTVKTWMQWAKTQNYMSPLLLQWLAMPEHENMSGGKYFYMDPNEDMEGAGVTKVMCTPRSWTNAMRKLATYSETGALEGFTLFDIPRRILQRTLNQYVPAQAVDSFIAFLDVISKVGNFDAAVKDIWKNGGKNFKLAKKDLQMVALPISQLVVSAHSQSYPDQKEFENLCTWMVAQNSDQLASYILDILQNVFAGMLPEKTRPGMFIMAKKIKVLAAQDSVKADMYRDAYKPFTDKWGFTLDTMPDYSVGHQMLAKAYGAAFSQALVDGAEGLG
jgi:hypothetical protein